MAHLQNAQLVLSPFTRSAAQILQCGLKTAAPRAAFTIFRTTGVWLYPFLDASKPWAPLAYAGIYAGSWVFFGIVTVQFRMRAWLSRRRRALKHD